MKSKKLLSFVTAAVMSVSLFPTFALRVQADETTSEKNISLGTSALSGYDNVNNKYDYIYYGTYAGNPIKWRILTMNGNEGTYKDNNNMPVTSSSAMFLLSEYALKQIAFSNTKNIRQTYISDWQYSDVWKWCNDTTDENSFIYASFTADEKKYLLKTHKDNSCAQGYTDELNDDTFFLLSKNETESEYMQHGMTAKLSSDSIENVQWWLRTPVLPFADSQVYCVNIYGNTLKINTFDSEYTARPAFNLKSSSVLFTSAADGKKTAQIGTISENAVNTTSEYKLTMKDSTRSNFTAKVSASSGKQMSVSYTNAKTGTNEYISAIIVNAGGAVTHYGVLANVSENGNGIAPLDLTGITLTDNDKIYIFNEQINGDCKTDFSSELHEVAAETKIILTADKVSAGFIGNSDKTLIVASYKDNTLKDVKTIPFKFGKYENTIEEIGLETEDANKIKAFLWNDMTNLTPLCEEQEVTLKKNSNNSHLILK